jgi:TldD protein
MRASETVCAQAKGPCRSLWHRPSACAFLVLALIVAPAAAQTPTADNDIVLKALRDEMARSRGLRLVDLDRPYYFEYALDDTTAYSVVASFGALMSERHARLRIPRIQVRVGDYAFDNTNHVFSDVFTGARFDPHQFPLDDNYEALRHSVWLATDRAFKQAVEAIARKRAALKNITVTEQIPDFSKAEPLKMILPSIKPPVDENAWKRRVRALSGVFTKYPAVHASVVEFETGLTTTYLVTSEGAEQRFPDNVEFLRARAEGYAPDGSIVRDSVVFQSLDISRFPSELDLERGVRQVAENLTTLGNTPVGEPYAGPVMFEGEAACAMFAQLIGRNVVALRRPVAEPSRPMPVPQSDLEGRIGARIMPEWMDVVDDPTQKEWHGRQLFGHYSVDIEGLVPKPVTVVEKGVLKNFLTSRQPIKGFEQSNARARIPGSFGAKAALVSNLFINASQPVTAQGLREKLMQMVIQRNKPYGIIVKKLDFPSSASLDELRRMFTGADQSTKLFSMPLLIYRVYPDGHEELERGLRFRGLTVRSLKDIVAASDQQYAFDYMENGAPFALMSGGNYVAPVTVIAPSVLFEDVELELPASDLPKPPVAPPPTMAQTN